MAAKSYGAVVLTVTVVLALFAASPALQRISISAKAPPITELSILGSYDNASYPTNIISGQSYQFYVNIVNQLGSYAYYVVEVKFRTEAQSAPNSFSKTGSSLPPLNSIYFCLANGQSMKLPITFSLNYSPDGTVAHQMDAQSVVINGSPIAVNQTMTFDWERGGTFGNLFFELWRFDDATNSLQYDQRYVSLWLNMTA